MCTMFLRISPATASFAIMRVFTVLDQILVCKLIYRDALMCAHSKNALKELAFKDSFDTITSGTLLQQMTGNPTLSVL
jgi:hypothetical protein